MNKYRTQSGSVYQYSKGRKAYVFIGKLNEQKVEDFIKDYEYNKGHKSYIFIRELNGQEVKDFIKDYEQNF